MPKTLLLADDSVVIQKLVGLSFANEDVELTTTDNGDDAIAKARELKPDLILADVVMPGKNGYEVCETIKADAQLRHIPVLLLTGTFEAFDENRARSAGSDGHITKPFEAQALVDRVNELLASAPAAPQLAATTPTLDGPAVTRIAAANVGADESFDFFDDGVDPLAEPAAAPPQPAAPGAPVAPLQPAAPAAPPQPAATGAPAAPRPEAGTVPPPLPPPVPSPLEQPVAARAADALPPLSGAAPDLMSSDDALMPDDSPASTPPIDDLAFDADDVSEPLDPGATTVQLTEEAPTPPAGAGSAPADDLLLGDAPGWSDDLEISPEPIRGPAGDETQLADDLFQDAPPARPAAVDLDKTPPASPPIDLGASTPPAPPVDLDAARPPAAAPRPPVVSEGDSASDSIAFGQADEPVRPDPTKTMLADDLFSEAPPVPPVPAPPADLDLEMDAPGPADSVAEDFDVSSSDLEHSIPSMPALDLSGPEAPTPKAEPVADDFAVSEGLLSSAPTSEPAPVEVPPLPEPAVAEAPQAPEAGPDLTPIMRERVHETLERVAWEAFSDLSDTIVKQVVEKVEQVAWEVIPQMAEAAIKEEIRRMKGESDE